MHEDPLTVYTACGGMLDVGDLNANVNQQISTVRYEFTS
jgi:hypothetical protein